MNLVNLLGFGDICSGIRTNYEALRVGESSLSDKKASRDEKEGGKRGKVLVSNKVLFNIKRIIGSRTPKKIATHNEGLFTQLFRRNRELDFQQIYNDLFPKKSEMKITNSFLRDNDTFIRINAKLYQSTLAESLTRYLKCLY